MAGQTKNKISSDIVTSGIAVAALILFVATCSAVLPSAFSAIFYHAKAPDHLLVNALLLNIVLIIFGWRRQHDLRLEINERRKAEARATRLANTDPLTECLNRRSMTDAVAKAAIRAASQGEGLAFGLLDLDNFKQINDMHGHITGDAVLVEMVGRIHGQLPSKAALARLGGDEFAFVLPFDPLQAERIDDLVIRIFEQMALPIETAEATIHATISIGLAREDTPVVEGDNTDRCARLMHRADIAMYHAKKQGKNCFFWFEATMENELRFRNKLETGIRAGLVAEEFVPYYEQQIDIDTGQLVGFEMLARWRSPEMGIVSPEIFIPIAEEIGVITELSEQLMDQAFTDAMDWDASLTLSINISPIQMRDPWFAQKLLRRLVSHKFPPQRLEIEITESCLHENIGLVRSMITSLRNQGVRISLDDFGTGYSSLEQLRTLPFDRLKIDRAFVGELKDESSKAQIVDTIVALGRGLDMPITAEGVEDEDILNALKNMGKIKGQGYLYGKPESADEVRERLAQNGMLAAANSAAADAVIDQSDRVRDDAASYAEFEDHTRRALRSARRLA